MPPFDSCLLKIRRAEQHFQTLREEIGDWNRIQRSSLDKETDPEGREHVVWLNVEPLPSLEKLSLITGDCIHNLRCAIDHFVYTLAIIDTGANPPPHWDALQFPIVDSPEKFPSQQQRRLSGLNRHSVTLIERAQPYNRPNAEGGPPLLSLLRELDNADKHRLLNVALFHMSNGEVRLPGPPGRFSDVTWSLSPIKGRTKIAFFTGDPVDRDVNYEVQLTLLVMVRHIAGPNGSTLSPLLGAMNALLCEVKWITSQGGI